MTALIRSVWTYGRLSQCHSSCLCLRWLCDVWTFGWTLKPSLPSTADTD